MPVDNGTSEDLVENRTFTEQSAKRRKAKDKEHEDKGHWKLNG